MKIVFLSLTLLGLLIPLACNNVAPTSGSNTGRFAAPTGTPTNLNGWTSTPTPTLQPTPGYVGTIATGISAPNGLAYANSLIYVAEGDGASVSQVQVLNAGTNAVNWTWTGSGSNLFQFPNGVAANAAGTTLYVLDSGNSNTGNGTVYALAPAATPTPLTSWTSYNGTTLSYPGGIALDSTGNVYVADTGNGRLEEFGPAGVTIAEWSSSSVYPVAVALDSANHVYVADGNNNELWVLSSSGSSFTVSNSWYLPYTSDFAYYGLTVDSSNNVYLADYYNSEVVVYTNTGSLIGEFSGSQTGATPLAGPDGLLLYNSNIYVADYDSNTGSGSSGIVEIFGPNNY